MRWIEAGYVENILDKWINKVTIALIFLVPLFFTRNVETSFTITKATILWIFSIILIGLLLLKKTGRISKDKNVLYVLLAAAVLSSVFSISPYKSLLGERERYEGLVTAISYLTLFYVGMSKKVNFDNLLRAVAIASIPISIYGLMQFFKIDFFVWNAVDWSGNISASTLGQPNVLGAYFALILPLFIGQFLGRKKGTVLYAVAGSLGFLCLMTSFTRGAWVGVAVASAIIGSGLKHLKIKIPDLRLLFIAYFVVISAILFVIVSQAISTQDSMLPQMKIASMLEGGIPDARIAMIDGSLRIAREYSLFGAGLDSFSTIFPKFRTREDTKADPAWNETHPHNQFIDTLVSTGLFGLTAFLWILVLVVQRLIISMINNKKQGLPELSLLASIAGFMVATQAEMSSVSTMPLFWLVLGWSCTLNAKKDIPVTADASLDQPVPIFSVKWITSVRSVFAIVIIAFSPILLLPYFAETYYWQGNNLQDINQLKASVKVNPLETRYLLSSAKIYMQQQKFQEALKLMNKAQQINPEDWKIYYEIGNLYLSHNSIENKVAAKMSFGQAKKLNPYSNEISLALAKVLADLGDINAAKDELERTKSISKNKESLLLLLKYYDYLGNKQKYHSTLKYAYHAHPEEASIRELYLKDNYKEFKREL